MAEVRVLLDDPRLCGLVVEDEHMMVRMWLDRKQVEIVLVVMRHWMDQPRAEQEKLR